MILVAGGTGRLGTRVVHLLRQRGMDIRVLTRDRRRAADLIRMGVQLIEGDIRDPGAVRYATRGVRHVVSTIQGFAGTKDQSPATVDRDGNYHLIDAARESGVEHMVFVSVKDAGPDHPMDLMRMKYLAERKLQSSGLQWTILRPAAYMETWCDVLDRPLLERGRTQISGYGRNPINWVSASDVAGFVELSLEEEALRGHVTDVGGPENLSMTDFVAVFRTETGARGTVRHVPPLVMRLSAAAMARFNPELARQIQAGIVMDTQMQAFDALDTRRRFPSIPVSSLSEVVDVSLRRTWCRRCASCEHVLSQDLLPAKSRLLAESSGRWAG